MARIHHILATTIACSLSFAAFASEAQAARPRVKGADGRPWRLHFDTELLGFQHIDYDGDNGSNDADTDNNLGFGIGRLTLGDAQLNSMGIGFGYAFLDTRAIVGARFSLVVDGTNLGEDAKSTYFRSQFAPYFQWMFLPDSWVRPYVEARIGIGGGVSTATDDPGGPGEVRHVRNTLAPFGGVGGGVHLFPVDYFSIDLGLNINLAGAYTKGKDESDAATVKTDWNYQLFSFNLGAMVGVSTWF
jgi:hypothetical protein